MEKHESSEQMKKDLDNLLSKINALEVSSPDDYQKNIIKVLRYLVQGQIHSVNEFEHLKKAIDLVTLQLFEVKNNQIFYLLNQNTYSVMESDILVAIPLFLFMGYVVERANIVNRLFFSLQLATRHLPGSMAAVSFLRRLG